MYSGSDVLINKAGIRNRNDLDSYEADLTAIRLFELVDTPLPGDFNLAHLQAIHRHIFQDVYDWAGELRQADIQKGGSKLGNWQYKPDILSILNR